MRPFLCRPPGFPFDPFCGATCYSASLHFHRTAAGKCTVIRDHGLLDLPLTIHCTASKNCRSRLRRVLPGSNRFCSEACMTFHPRSMLKTPSFTIHGDVCLQCQIRPQQPGLEDFCSVQCHRGAFLGSKYVSAVPSSKLTMLRPSQQTSTLLPSPLTPVNSAGSPSSCK